MSENKEVYNIDPSVKEVVITHKKALDEKEPIKIGIEGNIDAPFRFIEKRLRKTFELGAFVFSPSSHIIINREKMFIRLIFNEIDPLNMGLISGRLMFSEDFSKWYVNTGESWSHLKLSEFIKMNRYCFDDKTYAMKLSTNLADIKVKSDAAYERSQDKKGNTRYLVSKDIIQSNIPESFKINVPLFKGQEKVSIEVELYVDPNTYEVSLVSPEAMEIIDRYKEEIFDKQIDLIVGIAPDIPIIDQ